MLGPMGRVLVTEFSPRFLRRIAGNSSKTATFSIRAGENQLLKGRQS
jgi:hypothetical protein